MKQALNRYHSGFTIIELLIVIVVIAILAAITIVAYNGITSKAQVAAVQSDAEQAAKKVAAYVVTNAGQYPTTLADAGLNNSSGVTYQYTPNQTGGDYCITATVGSVSANAGGFGNEVNTSTLGPCLGHTGTAPTTLDDGSSCPSGFIVVPGNSTFGTKTFCVMKYEAKNDGGHPQSVAAGTPWVSISQANAATAAQSAVDQSGNTVSGSHLITEAEWMTIAANVMNVASNWSGDAVGSGYIYSGHNDNAPSSTLAADTNDANGYAGETNTGGNQRRTLTLTNGQVIWDFAGNAYEWTSQQLTASKIGNSSVWSFTWLPWNQSGLLTGNLPAYSLPGAVSSTASSYSSSQGAGQLYANYGDAGSHDFIRGGSWASGSGAGIFGLNLSIATGGQTASIGFRVTQ